MRLTRIILDDFLTFDHFDYNFEQRPLLIQGENLTDDNQKSNGSGKSALQTGIEFCITASNSRDVRDIELITYFKPFARTQLFAACDVRKEELHINWKINRKGSNELELKTKQYDSDEWINLEFSNVPDGKKRIHEWFAISKEDLFNYYIINETRFKSFFKSSNKDKVDLINRFSDASIIEGLENIDKGELEEAQKNVEKTIQGIEGKIELTTEKLELEQARDFEEELLEETGLIEGQIEGIKREISYVQDKIVLVNQRTVDHKTNIIRAEKGIEEIEGDKTDIQVEIDEMTTKMNGVKTELEEVTKLVGKFISTNWDNERKDHETDLNTDKEDLEDQKKRKKNFEKEETDLLKIMQNLEVTLSGSIRCPKCEYEFVLDGDINELQDQRSQAEDLQLTNKDAQDVVDKLIDTLKEGMLEIEEMLSKINKKEAVENQQSSDLRTAMNVVQARLNIINEGSTDLKNELQECEVNQADRLRSIEASKDKITNIKTEIKNFRTEIKNFETRIKEYQKNIVDLRADNNDETILALNTDLDRFNADILVQQAELLEINDSIFEKNQWIINFKQFRMFLANQSLSIIEYHNNRYLKDMGSDMRVKLEGFKLLASGETREEITAKVIRNHERSVASFSGGEKGRLLFASILANRHMINETHPYGGLDFLGIDEVFDRVDSLGLKYLIESAKVLKICVMIITHVTDEEVSSDTLLFVKENNITHLKQN